MHFAFPHFLLLCLISHLRNFFILHRLNNLVAQIVVEKAKLDALVEEKKDLKGRLEQLEGQVYSLQGDVETRDNELIKLRNDVYLAQESKNRDDFYIRLLESKRDSTASQLSKAQKGFECELARLNSKLLARGKDLDLAHEKLATSQKHNHELSQRLASSLEEDRLSALNFFEVQGALAKL